MSDDPTMQPLPAEMPAAERGPAWLRRAAVELIAAAIRAGDMLAAWTRESRERGVGLVREARARARKGPTQP